MLCTDDIKCLKGRSHRIGLFLACMGNAREGECMEGPKKGPEIAVKSQRRGGRMLGASGTISVILQSPYLNKERICIKTLKETRT